jgi:hypothetical protein
MARRKRIRLRKFGKDNEMGIWIILELILDIAGSFFS